MSIDQPSAAIAADSPGPSVPGRGDVVMRHIPEAEWEKAVRDFDDLCQEQLTRFARARWPSTRPETVLFLAGEEVVGGCLVMVQPMPLRLGAIAVVKWGPMLAHATREDAGALHAAMIERMIEHYGRERRMMISVMAHVQPQEGNARFEQLLARGFRKGPQLAFPDRYLVRVLSSEEEQRRSLEQKWRYNLNKAEKAGLSFERASLERLAEFDALYRAMTGRKRFPDYSAYDTVPALAATEDDLLRPELFLVSGGGEVLAGAIVFKAGRRAAYLYGATADGALQARAGYFLQWHILRWLRENSRAEWYDLGGTDGFHGLHQFKKGLVGSAGVIAPLPPAASFASYRLPFLLGQAAFGARELVHGAQRLLDRLRPDQARPDQARDGTR